MDKRVFISIVLIFLLLGCSRQGEKKKVVAYVGKYETTVDDFNAYREKTISISLPLTLEQKTKLLDNLIDRQLLIQAAVNEGLDKKKDFLKEIEEYWHQVLIKRIVDKKSKEIAGRVKVYKREKESYYRDVLGKDISAFVFFLDNAEAAEAVSALKNEDEIRLYVEHRPAALLDSREGQIRPQDLPFNFTREIYSRQTGEFTQPVKIASNLWMLGYVRNRVDNGALPEFSEVENEIETAIKQQKELEEMEAWLRELRIKQKIVINKDLLSKIK